MKDLTEYTQWLKVHRKCSPRTRELYTYNLERFFNQVEGGEFNQSTIDSFFASLHDKVESGEVSKNHVNTFIAAINSYNEFMLHKGERQYKTPQYFDVNTLPKYVDFEELEKVIDSFDDIFKNSLQKKALMMFMMYVPLRKSDVVRLKRSQFDLDNGYLRFIVKKTDNEIKIPIVSVIIPVLQLYFMKESEKNNAFNTSIPAINYLFRQIKEWHNIDVTPHMTRSTFAVWYLQSRNTSSALKELQQILGHRSIETTSRYCRLLPQDLKEGMESVFKNRKKNKKR